MPNANAGSMLLIPPSANAEKSGDQQLLERFVADGDEAAFAGLVQRHGRLVWNVCRRFLPREQDAEDTFQAVFVVLARKAPSIRNGEAVGSWLYGVAYRLALRAKQVAARRKDRELKAKPGKSESSPPGEAACRELQRVLDEEVMRLKDKYRMPFVLCCLEGMSKAEAAKELKCKEGTVSGRLARARAILQTRLARRGFTLSAALTAVALGHSAAWAAAPAVLLQTTASTVLTAEAGAGPLSPSVVSLADGYLRHARMASLATVLAILLMLLILVGGGAGVAALSWQFLGGADDPVEMIEPDTFEPPGVPMGTPVGEQVLAVAFSPDGKQLVTAGAWGNMPGQLKVWNPANTQELAAVTRIPGVRSVAFSPDGKTIATGDFSGALTLRGAATTDEIATVKAHTIGVGGVAYSHDGETIASAGLDGTVKLWNAHDLRELKVFQGHTDRVYSAAFFRHGQAIVTCGQDRTAKIWDINTGKENFTLKGHRFGIEALAVSPDDKLVATASTDQTVKLWDAETGEEVAELAGDVRQAFLAVAFSTDGTLVAAGGRNGTIQLWDVKTRQLLASLEKHDAPIWALAFSRTGFLASGSADRTAKVWPIQGKRVAKTLTTSWSASRPIRVVAYAPSGKALAVATADKKVYIRDAKSGDVIMTLHGHTAHVNCLAFSRDGKTLASGSDDQTIRLWDWASGDEIRTLAGHVGPVQSLVFSADGQTVVSAGDDKLVRIWDVASGKETSTLRGHARSIRALALSLDGRTLASGSMDGAIKLWNLTDETETHSLTRHRAAVRALVFSSDGALASASDDMTVKLWDAGTGEARLTLEGHAREVLSLAFTPKGRTLVSASHDGTVRVWDPLTGVSRGVLKGHKNAVTTLAMHPHGHNLVSGSVDTLLLRWQSKTEPGDALKAAKKVAALDDKQFTILVDDTQDAQDKDGEPKKNDAKPAGDPAPQLVPRVVAPRDLPERIAIQFSQGVEAQPNLRFVGPQAGGMSKVDAQGLRFVLPGDRESGGDLAVESQTTLRGDFEITLGYELLVLPDPPPELGAGATLQVHFDTPDSGKARLSRTLKTKGHVFGSNYNTLDKNGKEVFKGLNFPKADENIRTGRLRLTRDGTKIAYQVDEGGAGFRTIATKEVGGADVLAVRAVATTGWKPFLLDVRFTTLEMRWNPATKAEAPPLAVGVDAPPGTPDSGSWLLLTIVLVVVAASIFLVAGGLLLLVVLRKRPPAKGASAAKRPLLTPPAAPVIFFQCSSCGKNLKVKANLIGKKVKCRQCAKAMLVPAPEEDETDIPVL